MVFVPDARPGRPPDRAFDPATGDWLPAGPAPDAAASDPAGRLDPTASEPRALDAPKRTTGARIWNAILGIDLGLIGLFFLASAAVLFLADQPERDFTASELRAGMVVQAIGGLVVLAVIPLAWGVGTRVGGWRGMLVRFQLDRPWPAAGWGVLVGIGVLVVLAAFGFAIAEYDERTGDDLADNPELERIGAALTWPVAILVAVGAAVGEEVFFRGLLQRWIGVWGQAVLFGLAHLSYGTELQVVVPFALGLFFGWLVKRGARLWLPIVAHFTYDIVALWAAMEGTQEGPAAGLAALLFGG